MRFFRDESLPHPSKKNVPPQSANSGRNRGLATIGSIRSAPLPDSGVAFRMENGNHGNSFFCDPIEDQIGTPRLFISEGSAKLLRMLPTIENTKNQDDVAFYSIIDRVRKPLRKQPMEAKHLSVNPRVEYEGINVGKQAVLEIVTDPDLLTVVKVSASRKIRDGGLENPDSHGRLRRRRLASSQSTCCSSPAATRASVIRSSASCQRGESNSSSTRLRSVQRASINLSFSGRGNPIACSSTLMGL